MKEIFEKILQWFVLTSFISLLVYFGLLVYSVNYLGLTDVHDLWIVLLLLVFPLVGITIGIGMSEYNELKMRRDEEV